MLVRTVFQQPCRQLLRWMHEAERCGIELMHGIDSILYDRVGASGTRFNNFDTPCKSEDWFQWMRVVEFKVDSLKYGALKALKQLSHMLRVLVTQRLEFFLAKAAPQLMQCVHNIPDSPWLL